MFGTVAIVGLGLIGGSLALELKHHRLAKRLIGYDQRSEHVQHALERELVQAAFTDWNTELATAELVVLAVPVGAFHHILPQIASWLRPGAILTDVGSVKQPILKQIQEASYQHLRFVGGHPIAGSEKFGPQSAQLNLFRHKKFLLTPLPETDAEALAKVRALWEACGCHVHEMDAERHDYIYAEVSHLPHLLAYAVVESLGQSPIEDLLSHSGAGLKDFSRIASSSPEMWADIFLENQVHVLQSLSAFENVVQNIRQAMVNQDREALIAHFQRAKKLRDRWMT